MRLVVAIVTQKQLIVSARIHCFLNNSVFFLLKSNFLRNNCAAALLCSAEKKFKKSEKIHFRRTQIPISEE